MKKRAYIRRVVRRERIAAHVVDESPKHAYDDTATAVARLVEAARELEEARRELRDTQSALRALVDPLLKAGDDCY